MKKMHLLKFFVLIAAFALVLTGCNAQDSTPSETAGEPANSHAENKTIASEQPDSQDDQNVDGETGITVDVEDIHGTVTVPVNPSVVVALDNRTFETLSDWNIPLAAAPKDVMPADSPYVADETVKNVGNHREPNLEIIAAVEPEVVIIGQRFRNYYEEIKALVPNAAVVDLSFDISEEAGKSGDDLVNGLKNSTIALGKIFDKNDEAEQLNTAFDKAIAEAKEAYDGKAKVMSVVVSGGEIGFSAPYSGRVWGPMYDIFGWVSALDLENATSDHKGDDISVEAIAQSNPDWIMVLDREASMSSGQSEEYVPAQDVIHNSPALQNTVAVSEDHIVVAPNDTYTNESIQTYLELFEDIAKAFAD